MKINSHSLIRVAMLNMIIIPSNESRYKMSIAVPNHASISSDSIIQQDGVSYYMALKEKSEMLKKGVSL